MQQFYGMNEHDTLPLRYAMAEAYYAIIQQWTNKG